MKLLAVYTYNMLCHFMDAILSYAITMLSYAVTWRALVDSVLLYVIVCFTTIVSCHAVSCNAMQCVIMPCNVMQCHAMRRNVIRCHTMSHEAMQYQTLL